MPYAMTDDWFRLNNLDVKNNMATTMFFPNNSVVETHVYPSVYKLKWTYNAVVELNNIHPVWMNCNLSLDKKFIAAKIIYQKNLGEDGLHLRLLIINPKHSNVSDVMYPVPIPNIDRMHDLNVPDLYVGSTFSTPLQSNIPNQFTWMTHPDITIKMNNIVDWTFEVTKELTEDVYIQYPVGNPILDAGTIYGHVSDSSRLPEGAVVGIVGVKSEFKLDADLGGIIITGDDRKYFTMQTQLVQEYYSTLLVFAQQEPLYPTAFENFITATTLEQHPMYRAFMSRRGQPYYACGVLSTQTTFGTGLFVHNCHEVAVLPWERALEGVHMIKEFHNDVLPHKPNYSVGELLDARDWHEVYKTQITTDLRTIEPTAWLPILATHLQTTRKHPGMYRAIHNPEFFYPVPMPAGRLWESALVTPLFTTNVPDSVIFKPANTFDAACRLHLIDIDNLNFNIDAQIYVDDTFVNIMNFIQHGSYNTALWRASAENVIQRKIFTNSDSLLVSIKNPIDHFDRDRKGWVLIWNRERINLSQSNPTRYRFWHAYRGQYYWICPDPVPTVGQDSTPDRSTCVPVAPLSTMMMTALFRKGTPVGRYCYTPFDKYYVRDTAFDFKRQDPMDEPTSAIINTDSMHLPFVGDNIITTQIRKLEWQHTNIRDDVNNPAVDVERIMEGIRTTARSQATIKTVRIKTVVEDREVPLVGYPVSDQVLAVAIDEHGVELCDMNDLLQTAPFTWIWDVERGGDPFRKVVALAAPSLKKIYIIEAKMEVDAFGTEIMVGYGEMIKSIDFFETPFGPVIDILGMDQTIDNKWFTGSPCNTLALHVRVKKSNPHDRNTDRAVVLLRYDFEFDMHTDMITRIFTLGPNREPYTGTDNEMWPKGIAIMYPYVYTLGYMYTHPINIQQPWSVSDVDGVKQLTGGGWQICLIRTDMIAGSSTVHHLVTSNEMYRFTYGIPALETDYRALYMADKVTNDGYAKYNWGPSQKWVWPASPNLPKKDTPDLPTIAGLAAVSGQLFAVHNGLSCPILINPVNGFIETRGNNIFPYALPFNQNISAGNEILYTLGMMQGRAHTLAHPFLHICIGENSETMDYTTGIDIQDVSFGTTIIRKVYVRNNLLRDVLSEVELFVPDPVHLDYSEMLWLSMYPDGPWDKAITLDKHIDPCEQHYFYVKIEPEGEIREPITLYLHSRFNRTTNLFGYKFEPIDDRSVEAETEIIT